MAESYFNKVANRINANHYMDELTLGVFARSALASAFIPDSPLKSEEHIDASAFKTQKPVELVATSANGKKTQGHQYTGDPSFRKNIGFRALNVFAWPFLIANTVNVGICLGLDRAFGKQGKSSTAAKVAKAFFTWVLPPIAEVEMVAYGIKKVSDVVIDGVAKIGKKLFQKKPSQQTVATIENAGEAKESSEEKNDNMQQQSIMTQRLSDTVIEKKLSESLPGTSKRSSQSLSSQSVESKEEAAKQNIETPTAKKSLSAKISESMLTRFSLNTGTKNESVSDDEKPRRNTMR